VSEAPHFSGPGKHHAPFFSGILPNHPFTFYPFWRLTSSGILERHWTTDHGQFFECDRHHLLLVQATSNFSVCNPNFRMLFFNEPHKCKLKNMKLLQILRDPRGYLFPWTIFIFSVGISDWGIFLINLLRNWLFLIQV